MSELLDKRETFFHQNKDGSVDVVDAHTCELVETVQKPTAPPGFKYSPLVADLICQRLAEGESITKICKDPMMPSYNAVLRWRKLYPEFKNSIEEARKDRAEYFAEQVVDEAQLATNKENAPAVRVRVDALKWSAQAFNPDKFSPKTKVVGDPDQPVQFIIETGVRRKGDPGYVNIDPLKEAGQTTPEAEDKNGSEQAVDTIQETISQNLITGGQDAEAHAERETEEQEESAGESESKAQGQEEKEKLKV